jgi:predicted nucleic-acid-binding Zn-ribbon protein
LNVLEETLKKIINKINSKYVFIQLMNIKYTEFKNKRKRNKTYVYKAKLVLYHGA